MPKKKNHKNSANDFTIQDFADSKFSSFRPKKSTSAILNTPKPHMATLLGDEDRNWDDSDDELDFIDDSGECSTTVVKQVRKETKDTPGVEYPLAIWFLISEYIAPEDVGNFAAVCKSSHYTTTFAKFWNDIYRKYCKPFKNNLPEHLQPDYVNRRHGLRSLVIRSLFFAYPPFALRPPSNRVCTPEQLLKCKCTSVWYQRVKSKWCVYFKMLLFNYKVKKPSKNLLDLLDDIHANSQAGHRVLEVTCTSFTECTNAMGLVLSVIKASISGNMSSHRLTLGFSSSLHAQAHVTVMLDNVRTQVYDWWDPKYPHPGEVLPTSTVTCPNKFNVPIDSVES